jgi:hypothetical protein
MSTRLGDVTTATTPIFSPTLFYCASLFTGDAGAKSEIKTKIGSSMAYFRRQKPEEHGLSTRGEIRSVRHSAAVSLSGRDKVNPLSTLLQAHKNKAL